MASTAATKEPQNQSQIEDFKRLVPATIGLWNGHVLRTNAHYLCAIAAGVKD